MHAYSVITLRIGTHIYPYRGSHCTFPFIHALNLQLYFILTYFTLYEIILQTILPSFLTIQLDYKSTYCKKEKKEAFCLMRLTATKSPVLKMFACSPHISISFFGCSEFSPTMSCMKGHSICWE